MQPLPGPDPVRAVIGSSPVGGPTDATTIGELIGRAARAAHTVTGGAGFDEAGTAVDPEIAEILVRSVARSLLNPEVPLAEDASPFAARPGSFPDWSDADFSVLQRYRDRSDDQGSAHQHHRGQGPGDEQRQQEQGPARDGGPEGESRD